MKSLLETVSNKIKQKFYYLQSPLFCIVKSFSQLFFSDQAYIGCVFIIFIGVLSYDGLACALLGVITANLLSFLCFRKSQHYLRTIGGVGYNACIIGIYLTAFVIRQPFLGIATIIWVSAFTVLIDRYAKLFFFSRWGLPAFSLAAILSLFIVDIGYRLLFHIDTRNRSEEH